MSSRILLVDNDASSTRMLTNILIGHGYQVRVAHETDSLLADLRQWHPSALIAGRDLPLIDGIELCRRVRLSSGIPIIIISTDDDGVSEVAALDAGADDYIVKPFSVEKVIARLRMVLRRRLGVPEASALGVGEFRIDFDDRRVSVHGRPVRLTPKEFDLFVFMARNPNRVLPHRTLLEAVWGKAFEEQSEYLRVFVGQLRKKLELDPSHPRYFVTEPWVGYRFNPAGPPQ